MIYVAPRLDKYKTKMTIHNIFDTRPIYGIQTNKKKLGSDTIKHKIKNSNKNILKIVKK